MPPMRTEPVFFGLNGSETSYCKNSPVPQQETYKNLSSSDKSMSDTSGGTALKSLSIGGNFSGSAGFSGISRNFLSSHRPLFLLEIQTDPVKAFSDTNSPPKSADLR